MKHLVSICIPTYNGEQFIAEAMESAINQTYTNIEIVVSDDNSDDQTLSIINKYKEETPVTITVVTHTPTSIGANWNNCIQFAKGEYIKFLFQDDVLLPTCVEEMVSVLENDKKIGLVASKREIIIDDTISQEVANNWVEDYGDLQKTINLTYHGNLGFIDARLFKSKELFKCPINKIGEPTTFFFRKDLIRKIGYFSEDLLQILDFEFCCRILKKYKIAIINEKLVKFRLHSNQASTVNHFNSASENVKFHDILYKEYFWYFNFNQKIKLLKTNNNFLKLLFKIKLKLKSIIFNKK